MNAKTTGLVTLGAMLAAVLLFQFWGGFSATSGPPVPNSELTAVEPEINSTSVASPASQRVQERTAKSTGSSIEQSSATTIDAEPASLESVQAAEREAFYNRFDLAQIGRELIDEGSLNALVAYLRDDPELLAQFLTEYRATTDPNRASRLAQVLERLDDETIVALGEELVFSGNEASQVAGLDLLGGQQQHNPQARDIVSQVLEIETNPVVLSSALNALAKPVEVDAVQQEKLLNQFVMHSTHSDPGVRNRSLSLISRWAGEQNMNQHFIAALQDPEERVRISAVLSLAYTKHRDEKRFLALVGIVEDSGMDMQSRRTALLALEKSGLSAQEKQRLQSILAGG